MLLMMSLLGAGPLSDKLLPELPLGTLDTLGEAQGAPMALGLELPDLVLDIAKGQAWATSAGEWYEVDYEAAKAGRVGLCHAYALEEGAWVEMHAAAVPLAAKGVSSCATIDGLPELGFKAYATDGLPELGF